jgi:hypothetical protein
LLIALTAFLGSQTDKIAFTSAETIPLNITQAEKAVALSFNAVALAQKAGANVTELTTELNQVAALLAQAENAYRNGDKIGAINTANTVSTVALNIESVAAQTKVEASKTRQDEFTLVVSLSVTAEIILFVVLFIVWRRLKRNHIKNISRMKPEAISS